ncbi:hypothetical protein H2201_008983 [Coniosporium apollinis]|uniref:PLD phosphodiesterase domain-containing protein n=1 Tax=Coniosporium apollinis TaxID=61459 RepID=A0ABQ9NFI0_9PEZI|nr:hypothetical protein H2201_008983 [Coniosporium apollinis]
MSGWLDSDLIQDSAGSATLENLLGWLDRLDKAAPDGLHLSGIVYDKSYNESFPIDKKFQDDFTVFSPWGTWARERENNRTYPTPAQQALIDVVSQGIKADDSKCFIDIATLLPAPEFWTESGSGKKSVIDTIADAVNACSPNAEPVIRFLIGDQDATKRTEVYDGDRITKIFWNDNEPRIKHAKARLYVGYYSPNFHPRSTDDPAIKFVKSMKETIEKANPEVAKMLQAFEFDKHVAELVKTGARQISWNHGKIFAVNGRCIYTGGTNFWTEYSTSQFAKDKDKTPIDHNIVDHGIKIVGDAAVAGHKWSDYFWQYLDNPAQTDDNCICWATKLSDSNPTWWTRDGNITESTASSPTPILVKHDVTVNGTNKTVNGIPAEVKRSPFEKTMTFRMGKSQIRCLTVGKLGDWHGTMQQLTYPVMVIDLVRDLALNIFWQMNASLPDGVKGLGGYIYGLNKLLSDDVQKDLLFKQFKITPVAWASRHAMTKAIAYAKTSVILCQQCIVQTQTASIKDFQNAVDKINANKSLGIGPTNQWDGFIWPFDLLIALAQALGKISTTASDDKWRGIFIVLATKHGDQHSGWEDQTSIPRFKYRLKRIMLGLPSAFGLLGGGIPEDKIDAALSKYLHIRRVDKDNGHMYSHSKVVCVDKKLMYVGSDNAYPCYNEEHGVWVEDDSSESYYVGDWVNKFFDPYWGKCTEPKDEEEWFRPGRDKNDRFKREVN